MISPPTILNNVHATPIIDDIWIVVSHGRTIATLRKHNNTYLLKTNTIAVEFPHRDDIINRFGEGFFLPFPPSTPLYECYGYPTSYQPYNITYDIQRKLPMFTKSLHSKSLFCAGYYFLQLNAGWTKSFCPKLITVERYPHFGPYRSEDELIQVPYHAISNKPNPNYTINATNSCSGTE
jgi:hypothetical protein